MPEKKQNKKPTATEALPPRRPGRIIQKSASADLTLAMIEEREARLRSILETAPDAIITIDNRGKIQSFSKAAERLFGYASGEVIGHNVSMLMASPHREKHDGYLERYLRTGEKRIIGIGREVEARKKDGSIFPMELAVGEVKLDGAHLFTGFIRDLSARAKLENELRQAQKMEAIGQLTGGLAHDFNNLLTVISGNLEMLERRLTTEGDRELLKEAQEATTLGAQLASRLLAFGRRQPLNPELVDLNAHVKGMVDLLRRSLGQTIVIEAKHFPAELKVMADAGQLENVLLNLAINARDAMPDGGRLIVETAVIDVDQAHRALSGLPTGRYAVLSVTDTGTGMSEQVRERAFEPFFTTKGTGKGSGLGLSMIYGFVKQSGGHVQLYSELGLGTTVRIYLPYELTAGQETGPQGSGDDLRDAVETVLVVEDDPRVRRVSVRRLVELGYKILEAENGPEAMKIIEANADIDLLFTDVVMPGGISGVDLALQAKKLRPDLRILFTSGYADPNIVKEGLLKTDAGWLGKPYSSNDLKKSLHELLDR